MNLVPIERNFDAAPQECVGDIAIYSHIFCQLWTQRNFRNFFWPADAERGDVLILSMRGLRTDRVQISLAFA